MTRRSTPKGKPATMPISPEGSKPRPLRFIVAGLLLATFIAGTTLYFVSSSAVSPPASAPSADPVVASNAVPPGAPPTYVGAETCKTCHESEFKAWSGSHHQLAMQEATATSVLGDFANAKFKKDGVESTFFKRGDKFMVRTDGPDGKLTDYQVSQTFGLYPLQQYLIPFPGGRYQALPIAWDSRPKSEGGQHWFHLYPKQKTDHTDPLHWTGVYHNWALQCAECHSTNLHKGYDAASQTYKTTFSEINVACETCHGPASAHVDWAKQVKPPYGAGDNKGLPSLQSRWKEAWSFPTEGARFAVRDKPVAPAGMKSGSWRMGSCSAGDAVDERTSVASTT